MSLALVPVKALAEAKSRLDPPLSGEERAALTAAMLRDVLEALGAAPSVTRRVVVTPDPRVAEVARAAGAEAWLDAPPGLNPALRAAARTLARGDEPLLVVLGDVAGAQAADIEALFAALAGLGGRGVVVAPSSDGGTAALLRAPADVVAPCFGSESAKAHREAAERAGAPFAELRCESLAVDLDDTRDVARLLALPGGGAHTRDELARIGRGRARR